MKKTLALLLAAVLLAALIGGTAVIVNAVCACGDLDDDGFINIAEILIIRDIIFGFGDWGPDVREVADMNKDGVVDLLDLFMFLDIIFGTAN